MYSHIDLTLLKPFARSIDFINLCDTAIKYKTASVCVPSSMVYLCKWYLKDNESTVKICTVVGFPLGNCSTETKETETIEAINHGADEIDMVINLTWLKNGQFDKVAREVKLIKSICDSENKILKIIVETCYLTKEEKEIICKTLINAGVDYIKTSTGFGTGGATIEDVELFYNIIKDSNSTMKIKASGGIRTKEEVEKYLVYCDRIGMSCLPK